MPEHFSREQLIEAMEAATERRKNPEPIDDGQQSAPLDQMARIRREIEKATPPRREGNLPR